MFPSAKRAWNRVANTGPGANEPSIRSARGPVAGGSGPPNGACMATDAIRMCISS
ncbi:hypothetical protein WQQ_23220 [Hydrocarboniphaga effusa AP103]|uniref:Uncharacterized protein n=1 Tax=Hydrocarboniphaga effusa AP103 TaxID=1172194 RepID=I8TDX8_9GAMM|nr:hypothetical protein WQQ_23220 [Hydrocarboniphaga effusa AP103]